MISEDMAGQSISMAQKSAEIALELARLIKSMYDSHRQRKREERQSQLQQRSQEIPHSATSRGAEKAGAEATLGSGAVQLSEMKQVGASLSMQGNISTKDIDAIAAKAKEYDIPVAFIGKGGDNVKLVYQTNDKAFVEQILQDVMTDKLAAKPDDYLCFKMDNLGEAQTMSDMLEKNNIPADIVKGADGKYQCVYKAKNAEVVKILKADFKEAHESITQSFDIAPNGDRKYTLTDKEQGKTITLASLPTKEKLMRICKEQFGYSDHKAMEAAHRFESTLSGDRLKYFRTDTRQAALLNNFERNIKLKDDSLLVRPYSFTRANFSSDSVNRYFVSNGDKAAALIPDQMSRSEMVDMVKEKLGASEETAKAIVDKAEKIEVANKVADIKREAQVSRSSGDIGIERVTDNYAEISQNGITKRYDLRDKDNTIKAIQSDFGVPQGKAEKIFAKANRQSPLQNDFHKAAEKTKSASKPAKEKKTSKGARK